MYIYICIYIYIYIHIYIYTYTYGCLQDDWGIMCYIVKPRANGRRALDYIRLPTEVRGDSKICLKESHRICFAFMFLLPSKTKHIFPQSNLADWKIAQHVFFMYIYIYIHIHIHIHTYIYIYTYPDAYAYTYACTYTHTYTHRCIYIYIIT